MQFVVIVSQANKSSFQSSPHLSVTPLLGRDNIKEDPNGIGYTGVKWIPLTPDKAQYRDYVNT
jgi:hypothetical protein